MQDNLTTQEKKNLQKRYLFWLYKTTREALDRIDRKFTQLEIDKEMLQRLSTIKVKYNRDAWSGLLSEFKDYINNKEKDAVSLKYCDPQKNIKADYLFLKSKLRIVEKLIKGWLGNRQLKHIQVLYENEMAQRIMQEKEIHK